MSNVAIDEELLTKARAEAARTGFPTVDEFVSDAVRRALMDSKRARFRESARVVREAAEAAGLPEEAEALADFERFRETLRAQLIGTGEEPWLSRD